MCQLSDRPPDQLNQLLCLCQGQYNTVVDLTAAQYAMPASGTTTYSKLNYDTTKCGFQELYAAQEWGELQFGVSCTPEGGSLRKGSLWGVRRGGAPATKCNIQELYAAQE